MRVAIHGMGRIGRALARQILQRDDTIELVAVNELAPAEQIAHLLQFDTIHGRFEKHITLSNPNGNSILHCGHQTIQCLSESAPHKLPWKKLGVDLVFDCTGRCHTASEAKAHITAGAQRVLLSYPTHDPFDKTLIYGFNHRTLTGNDHIVSAASCTSNCVVPVLDVLHGAFGIESGHSTTIHAAMHDQSVIDNYAATLRQTRAASASLIPVDTGLARGVVRFFPHLEGRYAAAAVRIPTLNVSAIDLKVTFAQKSSEAALLDSLKNACEKRYHNIMAINELPLVSTDFLKAPYSVIVDATQLQVFEDGQQARLMLWFDNEWAYSRRMLELALFWMQMPQGQSSQGCQHGVNA